MSDRSYRINLPDAATDYNVIYRLKEYRMISREEVKGDDRLFLPIRFIIGENNREQVFTLEDTALLIVTEEIKEALQKAKVKNVSIEEVYGYTPEEALQWAVENPRYAMPFTRKSWFRKMPAGKAEC